MTVVRHRNRALLTATLVAIGGSACSSAHLPALPSPVAACIVGSVSPSGRDALSVAAMESIDAAHAPVPTHGAERLAFAQVYETLIDVDCDGRARPALAASWTFDATRTRITLVLRAGAAFSNGKATTAADVLSAWTATGARSTLQGRLARQLADGTTIVDEHTLIVSLPDTAWLVLADPGLAVYEARSAGGWPAGTGPYHVVESSASAPSGPLALAPAASSSDPYLTARPIASGDPRDAIDAGADVLVTRDPSVAGYAAAHPNLVAVPLPWTRTYALALPMTAGKIAQLLLVPDSEAVALRASLARDAVRAEARTARPPYWWDAGGSCGLSPVLSPASRDQRSNRVVYRRDDAVARGLAERLVALDASTVAAGLVPNDFARALHDGGDLAYVLDVGYASLSPCEDLRELRLAAPWLAIAVGSDATLLPLVDTRETALVNRRRVSATVDWRGTLRFAHPRSQP